MILLKLRDTLLRFDPLLAKAEMALSAACLAAVVLMMGAGTVARSLGHPFVFSDDLAISLMVWGALFSISANLAQGGHMRVDLLLPHLPHFLIRLIDAVCAVMLAGFVLTLWLWLDPLGLIGAGGAMQLAMTTGNYTYTEPVMTLGILKIWIWLPLVPASLGALYHALIRLVAPVQRAAPC
ncbi:TRAP transporter small permease subunit [Thioclava sp. GXIMD4215]|uniref:TRAP transporter small permease n=1 Tax=Thioclava sp. GXIMD4215 TaxID=3131928 RepID=UPI00311B2B22